jgi:hypothetical protein
MDEIPKVQMKPGNRRNKGRKSAPKAEERMTGKDNPIAYRFNHPSIPGEELDVLNSSRGWWASEDGRVKLYRLVDAFCFYYTDLEAIAYAGISLEQLKYFQELHPDFYTIKGLAKSTPDRHAKKKIVEDINHNVSTAQWWLERTQKDTFSTRQEQTGANGRDLYEGLSEDIRQMGEELRNDKNNDNPNTTKKHAGEPEAGNPDAGQGGAGHEASPTEAQPER